MAQLALALVLGLGFLVLVALFIVAVLALDHVAERTLFGPDLRDKDGHLWPWL